MQIVVAHKKYQNALLELYLAVSNLKNGIARLPEEINKAYISNIFSEIEKDGLGFIGLNEKNEIVAVLHASKYGIQIFNHVLSNLTILVHPDSQGKGFGKKIFQYFLEHIENNRPDIWRVELESRSSNFKSIGLYESLGFEKEGTMRNKTRNVDGVFEDSIMFAWFNKYYFK